jgi:hypothetical protein
MVLLGKQIVPYTYVGGWRRGREHGWGVKTTREQHIITGEWQDGVLLRGERKQPFEDSHGDDSDISF